ncbi:MAG: hypothetical protein CMH70_02525 [Nitrosomonadaceae bacterium]|nr:hypothetical protein [Nitrosomonadaceae bacterium]|tara:strand:+ start:6713 stop:7444 length:732 start_codon:yes stop_codon:yes gene_type:complete
MKQIIKALSRALHDLFQFRVLMVALWPIILAVFMWLILAIIFWDTFSELIEIGLSALEIRTWFEGIESEWIRNLIQTLIHLFIFTPLVLTTAIVIMALFAMPILINLVSLRDYPNLERKNGGSIGGTLLNSLSAICIFILIWVLTMPLWLFGIGVVIPFAASAYLNQRLLRYDALAIHASREEMKAFFSTNHTSLWVLGLLTGFVQFIPVLNFFAPVLAGLAFVHYGLGKLHDLRQHNLDISY